LGKEDIMRIHILTLFPNMFTGPFNESIIKRAVEGGLVDLSIYNIRDHTSDKHHVVDDYSYGGGPGMVLKPEPVFEAVEAVKGDRELPVILLTPQGRLFNQSIAAKIAENEEVVLICGHYEGVDERVRQHLATDEISIGDYVLSGGELAAMVVVDAVVRQIPGVLGSDESVGDDSHATGLLEYPQYTRPQEFRGWEVPEVLLSGNHAEVARWRREQSLRRTAKRRPDMLERVILTEKERQFLARIRSEEE
jgi:tRNA (guanine37-N1)-methyltransferase